MKTFFGIFLSAVVLLIASSGYADVSKPYTFTSGTTASALQVNANFDVLYNAINQGGTSNGIPTGIIVMWSGSVSSIPSGWVLCNGSNGTPNLTNRFVMGTSSTPGTTGGTNSVNLNHNHSISLNTNTTGNHTHTYSGSTSDEDRETRMEDGDGHHVADNRHDHSYSGATSNNGNHAHSVSGNSSNSLSSSVENRPAFYALAFIMKQ